MVPFDKKVIWHYSPKLENKFEQGSNSEMYFKLNNIEIQGESEWLHPEGQFNQLQPKVKKHLLVDR